jgi:hypothetical protein
VTTTVLEQRESDDVIDIASSPVRPHRQLAAKLLH